MKCETIFLVQSEGGCVPFGDFEFGDTCQIIFAMTFISNNRKQVTVDLTISNVGPTVPAQFSAPTITSGSDSIIVTTPDISMNSILGNSQVRFKNFS